METRAQGAWEGGEVRPRRQGQGLHSRLGCTATLLCEHGLTPNSLLRSETKNKLNVLLAKWRAAFLVTLLGKCSGIE